MSSAPSTDLENSREITIWIVLACSGLALVMFFGWIVKDLSALVSPKQRNSLIVQPLSETRSVSGGSSDTLSNVTSVIEMASSQTVRRVPSGSILSVKSDMGGALQKGSSALGTARESTAKSTHRVVGPTVTEKQKSGQSSKGHLQQIARQRVVEQTSDQKLAVELSATDGESQNGATEKHESITFNGMSQSEMTHTHPNTSVSVPSGTDSTGAFRIENDQEQGQTIVERTEVPASESAQIVAMQEGLASSEEFTDAGTGATKELPVQSEGVDLPTDPTAKASKTELKTEDLVSSTLSHTQRPSADFVALRQLLAEAAEITETENGQIHAERKRGVALGSLGTLSKEIRFAPGSKSVNEAMTSALNQIERILDDYPETLINVIVATNESDDDKQDMLLSQERGRTLIARFVNEGLAFSRLSLKALTDDQLPVNSHRVEIQAYSKS